MPTPADCTHRISSHARAPAGRSDPGCCLDCGTIIGARDDIPLWDHLTRGADPARLSPAFELTGYEELAWLRSELSPYPGRGRLEDQLARMDLALDREVEANQSRATELFKFVRSVRDGYTPGSKNLTELFVAGFLLQHLLNAAFRRGGVHDAVVPFGRRRTRTPFSGLRDALSVAFTDDAELGAGDLFSPDGVEATSTLPGGVIFGQMKAAPSRSGSSHARGERRVVSRTDVVSALRDARLKQQHVAVDWRPDDELPAGVQFCSTCSAPLPDRADCPAGKYHRVFKVAHPGTAPLSRAHVELLRLVLVGLERRKAKRQDDGTILPAIEPIRLRDAFTSLRSSQFPGAPQTEHQAKLMFKAAREAVMDQFLRLELIPPPERRRLRASAESDPDPFALPGS